MVAPTRTPQARGVKCNLCKKILSAATWLDQKKPAKTIDDAQQVLDFIEEHNKSECPCIPKNIENLLVGSTHFEIHRILSTQLDLSIHKKHHEAAYEASLKMTSHSTKRPAAINDLQDIRGSKFKLYQLFEDQKFCDRSTKQLKHLCLAIDSWDVAMRDQTNPFNSKLALRLGLTHHVIYACYLFKYYKVLMYQLISANLLLNLFKSVEGVTNYALIHAHYLMVKALLDCDQIQLAKNYLKQALKMPNYADKNHYESILLNCAECEVNLIDGDYSFNMLDDLAKLAVIQPDDKLQHYYARALALSVIVRYIHHYPARSDLCFEFYSTFRYISAIIRRCYESSFELVLNNDIKFLKNLNSSKVNSAQIPDHSWIKFAACDFVFSTFDLISKFYIRAGLPESLELLYNGLSLVSQRTCGVYWQARMASIGSVLDTLCDKYECANAKLQTMSKVIGHTSDSFLMNLLRIDLDLASLLSIQHNEIPARINVLNEFSRRLRDLQSNFRKIITQLDIYDARTCNISKMHHSNEIDDYSALNDVHLRPFYLNIMQLSILSMLYQSDVDGAKKMIRNLGDKLEMLGLKTLEYSDRQTILDTMLYLADANRSELIMLESACQSKLLLQSSNTVLSLGSQLSELTIGGECELNTRDKIPNKSSSRSRKGPKSLGRSKGLYDVASKSEENLSPTVSSRFFDTFEALKNITNMTQEEIVACYLRNSEPNPNFNLYKRAHELMFSIKLLNESKNLDQLLYHFCESAPSNSMRYRWMMYEEAEASPFDCVKTHVKSPGVFKYLSFSNVLINHDKSIKHFTRSIPELYRLVQMKTIVNYESKSEHLLIACVDGESEPIFAHVSKPITSDDFLEDAEAIQKGDLNRITLVANIARKLDEAKNTLFLTNGRIRTEKRQTIESELRVLLHDLENEWLGPFRFLLCGKVLDQSYKVFVNELAQQLDQSMSASNLSCLSWTGLKLFLDNALLLNRDEFCSVICSLYNLASPTDVVRKSHSIWLKSVEQFIADQNTNLNRSSYWPTVQRGQVGLILDTNLEQIPIESIPLLRVNKQGVFRVPSLRLFSIIASRETSGTINLTPRLDVDKTFYLLDPANNLAKTRDRFEAKLRAQKTWVGTAGKAPEADQLESWFLSKHIYLFIGHGAGMICYNKLRKGRGLSAMSSIKPALVVMGCSSGRVAAQGAKLESFGVNWLFIMRGSPSYIGLLWDVTDTDIDRFLDTFLANWLTESRWVPNSDETSNQNTTTDTHNSNNSSQQTTVALATTEAVARARHVCQFKFLVGSTPVVYGLPVWANQ